MSCARPTWHPGSSTDLIWEPVLLQAGPMVEADGFSVGDVSAAHQRAAVQGHGAARPGLPSFNLCRKIQNGRLPGILGWTVNEMPHERRARWCRVRSAVRSPVTRCRAGRCRKGRKGFSYRDLLLTVSMASRSPVATAHAQSDTSAVADAFSVGDCLAAWSPSPQRHQCAAHPASQPQPGFRSFNLDRKIQIGGLPTTLGYRR